MQIHWFNLWVDCMGRTSYSAAMKQYDASDPDDVAHATRMAAEPWQLLLARNPSYIGWGLGDDCMKGSGSNDRGWNTGMAFNTWDEHCVVLNDLNEVVNFYFSVDREATECKDCRGSGYSRVAEWISDAFYRHTFRVDEAVRASMGDNQEFQSWYQLVCRRGSWNDQIDQLAVDVLIAEGRLPAGATASEVNAANGPRFGGGMLTLFNGGHDSINRCILIEERCKKFGVPVKCPACDAHGFTYDSTAPYVSLTYWLLHPRKGASRGVRIQRIERQELPAVFAFLRAARDRNAERFAGIAEDP